MANTPALFRAKVTTEKTDDSAPVAVAQTYPANQTVIVNVPTVGGPFVDSKGNTYPPGSIQTAKHPTGGVIQAGADITVAEFLMLEVATGTETPGGVGDFVSLSDTPAALGAPGESVVVNAAGDKLDFITPPPPNATRTSINRAEHNDAIVYPLANGVLDLGFDWQTGDFIRFYLRRTNDGAWRTVDIKAQLPSRGDFDTVDLIFASASGAQGMNVVVGGSGTAGWEIREAELWVYGDNGHYIPTGTELVTERTLTLTTPSGATTHTVYDELEWPVNAALTDPGNEFVEVGTFTAASAHATGCHGTIGSNGSLLVQPDGVDCSITLTEKATPAPGPAIERIVYQRNRDQTMVFGDIQFNVPSSGNSSLRMRMGSGSMVISNFLTHWGHQQGGASEESINFTLTTSWRYFRTQGLNLTQHNNFQEATFEANGWLYSVGVIVGGSWQNNRFSFTRWRVESLKGDTGAAGADGTDGVDGVDAASIDHVSKTSGNSAPGTTDTYTLWADAGETTSLGTYDVPIPSAAGITTVELAAYDGASTTGQTFTLAGGRTWQNVLDEFQFVYVNLSGNNLFAHDQSRQWHVSDLSTQSRDMAITDYQIHGSNAYHYRLRTPAGGSTTVLIDNDGSTMSVQRIKVIGIK